MIDYAAARARNRDERNRRLRPDTLDQYREVAGRIAHYEDDPFNAPTARPPRDLAPDVAIVGGGFGGMLTAARLIEAGVDDLLIIDKAADLGGTWYWNRYPGARCDVDATVYLPMLEEVGYVPSEHYVSAAEILAYSRAIGDRFDLYRRSLLSTRATDCRWSEAQSRWVIETNVGDRIAARFLCLVTGPLHRPKLPGIEGIERFEGVSFHTARWNYAYTGGSPGGALNGLRGKVVATIGTGATAVQCIPHLADSAAHLYVFQRTPSHVEPLRNTPLPRDLGGHSGWHQRRMDDYNDFFSGESTTLPEAADGWTQIVEELLADAQTHMNADRSMDPVEAVERADLDRMHRLHRAIDAAVIDPATADSLKPHYRHFCKRPCYSDDYYATFNRANVTLVDTDGRGVDRIDETGVIVGERHYRLDCIVFATGFEAGTPLRRRMGFDVIGRDGRTLSDQWHEAPSSLHGIYSHGYPNCFVYRTAQAAATLSYPHFLNEMSRHVAFVISQMKLRGAEAFEVSIEAERAWVEAIASQPSYEATVLGACTPGYHNFEGQHRENRALYNSYQGGSPNFFRLLAEWRAHERLEGLCVTKGTDRCIRA